MPRPRSCWCSGSRTSPKEEALAPGFVCRRATARFTDLIQSGSSRCSCSTPPSSDSSPRFGSSTTTWPRADRCRRIARVGYEPSTARYTQARTGGCSWSVCEAPHPIKVLPARDESSSTPFSRCFSRGKPWAVGEWTERFSTPDGRASLVQVSGRAVCTPHLTGLEAPRQGWLLLLPLLNGERGDNIICIHGQVLRSQSVCGAPGSGKERHATTGAAGSELQYPRGTVRAECAVEISGSFFGLWRIAIAPVTGTVLRHLSQRIPPNPRKRHQPRVVTLGWWR